MIKIFNQSRTFKVAELNDMESTQKGRAKEKEQTLKSKQQKISG